MAADIWLRTILIVRKETRCRHIGYSYRLTARVLLYAPSHRQDNTYHGLCYTSRGALAGTRNSSMGLLFLVSVHRGIPFDIILFILLSKHLITQILCQESINHLLYITNTKKGKNNAFISGTASFKDTQDILYKVK